eukprot:16524-Alexandrium_andersonii.AAC.1
MTAPWDTPSHNRASAGVSPTQPFVVTPQTGVTSVGSFSQDPKRPRLDAASPRSARSGATSPRQLATERGRPGPVDSPTSSVGTPDFRERLTSQMAAMAADRAREGSATRRSRSTERAGEPARAEEAVAPVRP